LLDGFEVDSGFDPNVPGEDGLDSDLDGLDNLGEQSAQTDPHNPDSDGDGFLDGQEVAIGTDPNDPLSVPMAVPGLDRLPALVLLIGLVMAAAVLDRRSSDMPSGA